METAPAARLFSSLAEHHPETSLQLLVARLDQRRLGGFEVEKLFAPQGAAGALLTRFPNEGPTPEQVLLQDQLEVAWGLIRTRQGLHEDAHGQQSSPRPGWLAFFLSWN